MSIALSSIARNLNCKANTHTLGSIYLEAYQLHSLQ